MADDLKTLKKQTINAMFWKFLERILAQLVSFIVSIVLARILLPEEYGVIAVITVFISLADILVSNGLGASLIQKEDADEVDFNTMYYSGIVLSAILYMCLFFGAPLIARIYKIDIIIPTLRVMGVRIPISAINSIQQAYVSRKMDFKKFFISTVWGTTISGIVGIMMAIHGCGVWALIAQNLTNTVVDTLVLFFSTGWRPKLIFSFQSFRTLFAFGIKIMFTGFIGTLFNQLKSLIIGGKYSSEDLAYYNRGETFPLLITNNIESSINAVLFPALSKYQNDNESLVKAMRRFVRTSSYITMPLMIGLAVTGDNLVKILLTEKWLDCVPFMQVICIQQIFSILNSANLQVIKAKGKGDTLVKLEFIKKPIMLAFLIIMMRFSPMAIAIGLTVYELVAAYINSKPTRRLIGYSIFMQISDILHNLTIAVIMGVFVFFLGRLRINTIILLSLQVIIGAIIYIGLSYLTQNESFYYILDLVKQLVGKRMIFK